MDLWLDMWVRFIGFRRCLNMRQCHGQINRYCADKIVQVFLKHCITTQCVLTKSEHPRIMKL
jgi:hypothetical protein